MSSEASSSTVDVGTVALDLLLGPSAKVSAPASVLDVADRVDDVRRLDQRAVDLDAALALLERGLGDHAHLRR